MPTVYAAGNPDVNGYLQGITCNTTSSLITQIRDILTQAGCTVNSSEIAATVPTIRVTGFDGSTPCYTIWRVATVTGNQKELTIQGDFAGTGVTTDSNLSSLVRIPFYEATGAKLYLSTDAAGGVVFINNTDNASKSAHFGFLERTTSNPNMWMVGLLDPWLNTAQIATDIHNVKWSSMHRYFATTESRTAPRGAYQLLWDAMTLSMNLDATSSHQTTGAVVSNLAYKPWLGNVDAVTGNPNLGLYGYFIGTNTLASYIIPEVGTNQEKAFPLHFPGPVRFARTGLASFIAGRQFQALSGRKFISGGGLGEFQGFAISG